MPFTGSTIEYKLFGATVPPVIGIPVLIVTVLLVFVLSPVLIPLHVLLKAIGRRGFVREDAGRVLIDIGSGGFKKA